jgi:RNA polymerase sigma-70 factor (ECF subfamily)
MRPLVDAPVSTAVDRTDAELVSRAQRGDYDALELLVRRHKDAVFAVAYRIVGDRDTAEDVAQEALLRACRQIGRFRAEAAFTTWLYSITVNAAREHLRSERRRQARWERQTVLETSPAPADDPVLDDGPLAALLRELPEKHRIALALFYVEELSLQQISQAAGAPVGTVKAWLSRGREQLRRLAEEKGIV